MSRTVTIEKTGGQLLVLADVAPHEVRGHLIETHAMDVAVVDDFDHDDHVAWHAAEHGTRDPKPTSRQMRHSGHLTHTHERQLR